MATEVKDIFEATSKSVKDLLSENGLGLYIPAYQRPYSWDSSKVRKLVFDTFHGFNQLGFREDSFTFLGTVITIHDINYLTVQPIVRQDVPAKLLNVIDGQQRLTTIILFCVALHSEIRMLHSKYFQGKNESTLDGHEGWLRDISQEVLGQLESTFLEMHKTGDSPIYPKMIRAFDDQWSKKAVNKKYTSPIAHLVMIYANSLNDTKFKGFKPIKRAASINGEDALCERYIQISKILKSLNKIQEDDALGDLSVFPTLQQIAHKSQFQISLINHEFPSEVTNELIKPGAEPEYSQLLQTILLAYYLLNRVAVTVVRGKNEDYAFTIFESLNTTGEPLTAFETFKPQVVMAEGIESYENSRARQDIDAITKYLSHFKAGETLQRATRDLIIHFASCESGRSLSKTLAEQRRFLKDAFDLHKSSEDARLSFIQSFRDVSDFLSCSWENSQDDETFHRLPMDPLSDTSRLCLSFLKELNHTITIGLIVRFYSSALRSPKEAQKQKIKDLNDAIKAITAFSALWRASRRGTKNIDKQYRDILVGNSAETTNAAPFARCKPDSLGELSPFPDVNVLKAELKARLAHAQMGDIGTKKRFVDQAAFLPAYSNSRVLSRFLLLCAYHDAVPDPKEPGLIIKGKVDSSPCLTYAGYKDDRHLTLEHVAPQHGGSGWNAEIYSNKETIDQIGNLVLAPRVANSSFSARPWREKQVLYRVLGATSSEEASRILEEASLTSNINFGASTADLVKESKHLPHLIAIGDRNGDWSVQFIQHRSERLLGLAYDQLVAWLD